MKDDGDDSKEEKKLIGIITDELVRVNENVLDKAEENINATVSDVQSKHTTGKVIDGIETENVGKTNIADVGKNIPSITVANQNSFSDCIGALPDNIGAIPLKTVAPFIEVVSKIDKSINNNNKHEGSQSVITSSIEKKRNMDNISADIHVIPPRTKRNKLPSQRNDCASIVDQVANLFATTFRRDRNSKKASGVKSDQEYFLKKMKQYDTYYVSDINHDDKPTAFNMRQRATSEDQRIVVSAMIVEVTTFVQRLYKHYEEKDITEENKDKPGEVRGYKSQSKALILHNIATKDIYRGRGYARYLLFCIANKFKDSGIYIYCPLISEEKGIFIGNKYSAVRFLSSVGFQKDKKGQNFNLHIVDYERKIDKPITSKKNQLYRCHTTTLRSMNIEHRMYQTAKVLEVIKNVFFKVVYTSSNMEGENIDEKMKKFSRKGVIDVTKKNLKKFFSYRKTMQGRRESVTH